MKENGEQGRIWTKELYIISLIFTIFVFASGFSIGYWLSEKTVTNNVVESIKSLNSEISDVQMLLLSQEDKNVFCNLYSLITPKLDKETWSIGEKLEAMESQNQPYDLSIKYKYFQLEFRDYILSKKASEICNSSIVPIIYIYSNKDNECPSCREEGVALWRLRENMRNSSYVVRLYSFDGSMNDSYVVKAIYNIFNIKKGVYPVIVVRDEVFYGYMDERKIENVIKNK